MAPAEAPSATTREPDMAHKTVQLIIGQILTDEELRAAFLEAPAEMLASLRARGFDLTNAEMDALVWTDRQLWEWGPEWIDSRLQRCCLEAQASERNAARCDH